MDGVRENMQEAEIYEQSEREGGKRSEEGREVGKANIVNRIVGEGIPYTRS
jgi:hypothetical protein